MKGVEEGKEECPSSNTPRKMLKTTWKDQQYVERIMQRLVKKTPFLKLAERAQKSSTRMKTIQRPSGKLISAAAHQPGKVEHPKTRGSLECPGAAAENLMTREKWLSCKASRRCWGGCCFQTPNTSYRCNTTQQLTELDNLRRTEPRGRLGSVAEVVEGTGVDDHQTLQGKGWIHMGVASSESSAMSWKCKWGWIKPTSLPILILPSLRRRCEPQGRCKRWALPEFQLQIWIKRWSMWKIRRRWGSWTWWGWRKIQGELLSGRSKSTLQPVAGGDGGWWNSSGLQMNIGASLDYDAHRLLWKKCMVLENCRTSDVKMNPERKNLSRTWIVESCPLRLPNLKCVLAPTAMKSRAVNGCRLFAFVQIPALFQIHITDMTHEQTSAPLDKSVHLK